MIIGQYLYHTCHYLPTTGRLVYLLTFCSSWLSDTLHVARVQDNAWNAFHRFWAGSPARSHSARKWYSYYWNSTCCVTFTATATCQKAPIKLRRDVPMNFTKRDTRVVNLIRKSNYIYQNSTTNNAQINCSWSFNKSYHINILIILCNLC